MKMDLKINIKIIMTEIDEFILHVAKMREAQKSYFKSRSKYNLSASMRLEKIVDKELEVLTPRLPNTPKQTEIHF